MINALIIFGCPGNDPSHLELFHALFSEADRHYELHNGCKLVQMEMVAIGQTSQLTIE